MDRDQRIALLKKGGKTELERYNRLNRVTGTQMDMGTRIHMDKRFKKTKKKNRMEDE